MPNTMIFKKPHISYIPDELLYFDIDGIINEV